MDNLTTQDALLGLTEAIVRFHETGRADLLPEELRSALDRLETITAEWLETTPANPRRGMIRCHPEDTVHGGLFPGLPEDAAFYASPRMMERQAKILAFSNQDQQATGGGR